MIRSYFFASIISFQVLAAGLVEFRGTPRVETPSQGIRVSVYPEATVTAGLQTVDVKLTGFGLRTKTFLAFKLYMISSYMDNAESLRCEDTASSLKAAKAKVLELNMLRDMAGNAVKAAFEESLIENGVDVGIPAIQNILGAFDDGVALKDVIRMVSVQAEGDQEMLTVELWRDANLVKSVTDKALNLGSDVWKIWLGEKPVEASLKNALCAKRG